MKTIQRTLLIALMAIASAAAARAEHYVSAPVTIAVTVTSSPSLYFTDNGATLAQTVTKLSNKDLLNECVSRRLITSIEGWSLYVSYDSSMTDDYVNSEPVFFLKHRSGGTVDISSVMSIESVATSGKGSAKYAKGQLSGSLVKTVLYYMKIAYQGEQVELYGPISQTLKISGTPDSYYGISSGGSATLNGYTKSDYDTTISMSLKIGKFQ